MAVTQHLTPAKTFPLLGELLATPRLNFIGGQWEQTEQTFPVTNPANFREILGHFPVSRPRDVERAIASAHSAFGDWSRTPAPSRAAVLHKAISILKGQVELLAHALTWEAGKVLAEARVEVLRGIAAMEYLASEGRRAEGQTIPSDVSGMFAYTVRRPLGVVGLITPWNFPFAIPAWKLIPALVAGNTVVIKPAEKTPVCTTLIVKALEQAGLPAGVLNMVHGDGAVGRVLVEHPAIKAISFTGSTSVGKFINQAASGRLAKVQLELGGKNAAIVLADADLDLAAQEIASGAWGSTGQRCTATSRLIVERSVSKPLVEKLLARAKEVRVGDGLVDGHTMGPLINHEGLEKVERYMSLARQEGLTVAFGGERLGGELVEGYFYAPTLLTGANRQNTVAREEIFGPVLTVIEVDSLDEALEVANDVTYGLSSAIFTRDVSAIFQYAERIEAGLLHANSATVFSEVHMPFGGFKDSGAGGREMGPHAADFYTEKQTMYLRHRF